MSHSSASKIAGASDTTCGGIAPAAQVREITVGLVRGQDVPIDLWIHPDTKLVTSAEFTTVIDGAEATWVLSLDRYGDTFTINPPENVTD